MRRILFVCTGNYYRSRFAEEYFNHLAEKYELDWEASSRGLSQNMPSLNNPGPISAFTLEALAEMGIEGKGLNRYPRQMEKAEFVRNDRIIAMSEIEHRPMIEARFLAHAHKIEYFEVGDLPVETPKEAIAKIACLVQKLIHQINVNNKEVNNIDLVSCF